MRVRWTADAAEDLEQIFDFIVPDRPASARRVTQAVIERVSLLASFPYSGRQGRVAGTREIACPPYPFLAIYEVIEDRDEVQVLRILHGAQQWPPR